MKTFKHNVGLPRLQSLTTKEINGKRHYLLPSGLFVPSVTTVLGHFKIKALMEWRNRVGHEEAQKISNTAATRGTKVHNLMEKYLCNINPLDDRKPMPTIIESFNMLKKVVDKHVDNVHYVEVPLYSDVLKIAGRTDIVAEFDGELSIIDFKTSNKEKREEHVLDYFLQSAAYAFMFQERLGTPINKIVIMMATDGLPEPQIFVRNPKDYEDALIDKIIQYFRENGPPHEKHLCN